MNSRSVLVAMASLGAVAAPAAAQNSTAPPPVITIPPPTQTEAPPAPPAPGQPGSTAAPNLSEPVEPSPPQDVVVAPQPDPVPAEPVTIDPDAAYPEGFADPEDPFANDMADAYRQDESGFDWGLLGLLGLLGLIPLFRRRGAERVVYVERDDVGRRRGEG